MAAALAIWACRPSSVSVNSLPCMAAIPLFNSAFSSLRVAYSVLNRWNSSSNLENSSRVTGSSPVDSSCAKVPLDSPDTSTATASVANCDGRTLIISLPPRRPHPERASRTLQIASRRPSGSARNRGSVYRLPFFFFLCRTNSTVTSSPAATITSCFCLPNASCQTSMVCVPSGTFSNRKVPSSPVTA